MAGIWLGYCFSFCCKWVQYSYDIQKNNINDLPFCSFLYDHRSPAHRFYKSRVEEYRRAKSQSGPPSAVEVSSGNKRPVSTLPAPPHSNFNSDQTDQNQDTAPAGAKRKRKSRWGCEGERVELPVPAVIVPQMIKPDPDAPSLSGTLPYLCNKHKHMLGSRYTIKGDLWAMRTCKLDVWSSSPA